MRAGRAVRDQMRPDTPEAVAERILHRAACAAARADVAAKYGEINAENAKEALNYQEERIKFHTGRI